MNRNPPRLQSVQSIIDEIDKAIRTGNLKPLREMLRTKQDVDITKLYYSGYLEGDISILEYAIRHDKKRDKGNNNEKRKAEVVALLIEKKKPDLTSDTGSGYDSYQNYISNMRIKTTVARPVMIAHIVEEIELTEPFPQLELYMDWKLVQRCYRALPKDRVADLDWYKMQSFKNKGSYAKECHLAWAIACLLKVNNGEMRDLAKWTIAYAIEELKKNNPQPFLETAMEKRRGRQKLLKY